MALIDLIEQIGSVVIAKEQIKAGVALGTGNGANTGAGYPPVTTGVDSDGSTLVGRQLVNGVSNGSLLAGAGLLVAVGAIAIAWAVND